MLAAAFDGDIPQVTKFLDSGLPVHAKDANGTTALSEAASGGFPEAVKLLLGRRSDPNSRGEFERTPLWRAAYAGHTDTVQVLLEGGGDPRLYDDQGQAPTDVATRDELLTALREWDLARTDELIEDYESWFEDVRLEEEFRQKQAMRSVEEEFAKAKQVHEAAQAALARAKVAMRIRVKDHGQGLAAGHEEARLACASADEELQRAEIEATKAQARYDKANVARLAAAEENGIAAAQLGRSVNVADLNNVLLRDISGAIANSCKWPLLIDPSDCARKLLQYAGCAVLDFWKADSVKADSTRLALLSMLRAGGVLAVDLACFGAGVDLDLLAEPFKQVRPWLFDALLDRGSEEAKKHEAAGRLAALLRPQAGATWPRFHELVGKEEKKTFGPGSFDDERTACFKFMVLTSAEVPHQALLDAFDVIRVDANSL